MGWATKGGREADRKGCGINDKEGDANDVAVDESIDGLLFIEVVEGGGNGFEMAEIILGAGQVFAVLRRRVAPIDIVECTHVTYIEELAMAVEGKGCEKLAWEVQRRITVT